MYEFRSRSSVRKEKKKDWKRAYTAIVYPPLSEKKNSFGAGEM